VLDAGTAPALAARVRAALAGHRRVTVDLRHTVAVDAAGLRVLRRLPVVLQGPSPTTLVRLGVLLCLRDATTHPNAAG